MSLLHNLTLGDVLRENRRSHPRKAALVCGTGFSATVWAKAGRTAPVRHADTQRHGRKRDALFMSKDLPQ